MAEIRRLVQIIGRLFYEDGHILLLDQLVSIAVIPSDVLARRVGLQARDLGSLAAKLVEDRIVSVYRTQESREGPFQRSVVRGCASRLTQSCSSPCAGPGAPSPTASSSDAA